MGVSQQVQGSGRTTHFDRVSDMACSNMEHLARRTTHGDRVSDIALKPENLEHGGLCERASSYGRCIPLHKNTQPFSSFDPVSELSVHSDRCLAQILRQNRHCSLRKGFIVVASCLAATLRQIVSFCK